MLTVRSEAKKLRLCSVSALVLSVLALTCMVIGYHVKEERRPRSQSKISVEIGRFKFVRESKSPPDDPDRPWLTPERMRWTRGPKGSGVFTKRETTPNLCRAYLRCSSH